MTLEPGLYVTATPIGNLKDITFRAVETLKAADLILCEDTRQTAKLCAAYAIKTPRAPYHDHNAGQARPAILDKLQAGATICLVSDAGTPLISDPGYKLVRDVRDAGISVITLPGPSAPMAALSIAGAPTDRFLFAGFPPSKAVARQAFFEALADITATLVFFETAPRLAESLKAMADSLGDRKALMARELTKLHEETREGRLSTLADDLSIKPVKGEIVLIVHPPDQPPAATDEDIDIFLRTALQTMSVKEAATAAAAALGSPRRDVYQRALALKAMP